MAGKVTPPETVEPETAETETPATTLVAANGGLVVPRVRPGRLSFAALADNAAVVVEGYDLIKSKSSLIGVPFAIIGVTYRDGISEGDVSRVNYVSVELVTADEKTLKDRIQRGSIPVPVTVGPEETLVINDGSTGIARQITEILHGLGLINVGPIGRETGGEMGQSPYDRYRADWVSGQEDAEAGIKGYPIVLAPRGLRISEYDNPRNPKQKVQTYYLG